MERSAALTLIVSQQKCSRCGEMRPGGEFPKAHKQCRVCRNAGARDWKARQPVGDSVRRYRTWARRNPAKVLWRSAKMRAARKSVPFDISVEDIFVPEFCPVLGIKLEFKGNGRGHYLESPTLDRIVPALGYVRGNIAVISGRANVIKNLGTADEHERVAAWMRAMKGSL